MSPASFDEFKINDIWTQILQLQAKTAELVAEIKKLNTISLVLGVSTLMLSLVVFILTLVRL